MIALSEPTVHEIYFQDSRSFLKTIEDGTVQLMVTSPPYWNVTESGFDKEPKALSVESKVHTDIGDFISLVTIPEFQSFLILPLFMIATLLAVIVYRRKHSI